MKIFITGGEGQLGRALANVLSGEELHLGRHGSDDVTDPKIAWRIRDFHPDVVIHAAAMTDVDACELKPDQASRVNEQGTRNVAAGAQAAGALLVYVSTDYVFDGAKQTPYRETDATNPINVYGQSKLGGERVAEELDRWLIVRTSWVYGEGRKNFVTNVLEWARSQPTLRLVKDKVGSPTYARDLAEAIRHLIRTNSVRKVVHASGEGACTWVEYGREILKIAGLEKEIVPIAFDELGRPAHRPAYSALSTEALVKEGYSMRPWEAALEDFLSAQYVR